MSGHSLLDGIIAEAKAEAEAIVRQAKIDAEANEKQLLEEAEGYQAKKEAEVATRIAHMKRSFEGAIEMEHKRLELEHMSEMHQKVLAEVERRFMAMKGTDRYRSYLLSWIVEGVIGLGQYEARVQVSKDDPVDETLLREAEHLAEEQLGCKVSLELDSSYDPFSQGVTVSSRDGGVAYNNRLNTRMRRLKSDIHRMIYQYEGKHTDE